MHKDTILHLFGKKTRSLPLFDHLLRTATVNLNLTNSKGHTILHVAALTNNAALIRTLTPYRVKNLQKLESLEMDLAGLGQAKNGASLEFGRLDIVGRSALDLALIMGNCDAIFALLKCEESITFPSRVRYGKRYFLSEERRIIEDEDWELYPLFKKVSSKIVTDPLDYHEFDDDEPEEIKDNDSSMGGYSGGLSSEFR